MENGSKDRINASFFSEAINSVPAHITDTIETAAQKIAIWVAMGSTPYSLVYHCKEDDPAISKPMDELLCLPAQCPHCGQWIAYDNSRIVVAPMPPICLPLQNDDGAEC